ncbi:MAG: hypothetical protein P4L40_26830 [Terracidiphilus sp.]|nr:hypothetical protein [Terracidiphilus sp.]
MRLAPHARHLEVQLLADKYGNAIALSGRDCSVQRRHQKIIEEGPVLAASPEVWARMEQAAVALAKEVRRCYLTLCVCVLLCALCVSAVCPHSPMPLSVCPSPAGGLHECGHCGIPVYA